MKFRTLVGTAVVAVALFATGCGSLANNAAGLDRNTDGNVRQGVVAGGRTVRNAIRPQTRYGRANRRIGGGVRNAGRGLNRAGRDNRYLRQDDLRLNDGRYLGDGMNPATNGDVSDVNRAMRNIGGINNGFDNRYDGITNGFESRLDGDGRVGGINDGVNEVGTPYLNNDTILRDRAFDTNNVNRNNDQLNFTGRRIDDVQSDRLSPANPNTNPVGQRGQSVVRYATENENASR